MQIFVKTLNGRTITIDVECESRIADVRSLLSKNQQTSGLGSTLAFGGKLLRDDLNLADYNIQCNSTLHELSQSQRPVSYHSMQIYIKTPAGKTVTLEVNVQYDSVDQLRTKIKERTQIPEESQVIYFAGKLLKDGTCLYDYAIQNGSTLHLQRRVGMRTQNMHVFVKTHEGKTITMIISSSGTIKAVKAYIGKRIGIPDKLLYLMYGGKMLQDTLTLLDYNIPNEATLHQSFHAHAVHPVQVFVEIWKGKTLQLNLDAGNDVATIKKRIQEEEKIDPSLQKLKFGDKWLEDNMRLCDYAIKNNATIQVHEDRNIDVLIYPDECQTSLAVDTSTTVYDVKVLLHKEKGISASIQTVGAYEPSTNVCHLLDDQQVIFKDKTISNSLQLICFRRIQIYVNMFTGITVPVEVDVFQQVKHLKAQIGKEHLTKLDQHDQPLLLELQDRLLDDEKYLMDCSIKDNCTIQCYTQIKLAVNVIGCGKRLTNLVYKTSDKIHTIMKEIQTRVGVPPERQRLLCNSKLLQKDSTFYECGIGNNATVDLLELRSVIVKHGKGKQFKLVFHEYCSIDQVMEKIVMITSIPKQRQRLLFSGKQLMMGHAINEYGIKHNSTLDLEEDMNIYIRIGDQRYAIPMTSSNSVRDIKASIQNLKGIGTHRQCLTCDNKPLHDEMLVSSIGHNAICCMKEKECEYYSICQQVLSSLNLPGAYFDFGSKYNKCYCVLCHEERNESYSYKNGEGDRIYTKPIGWGRIILCLPPRAETLDIFKKWNVAYHGTTFSAVEGILDSGMLALPGDHTIHGSLQECIGHYNQNNKPPGFNTKQIFVSPSMKYAGCNVYAKKQRMQLPSSGLMDVRLAFQVRIHPRYLKIGHQTIGRGDQIDPPIANHEIEWSTVARDSVIPVALLIHVSSPESTPRSGRGLSTESLRAIHMGCATNYKPNFRKSVQPV